MSKLYAGLPRAWFVLLAVSLFLTLLVGWWRGSGAAAADEPVKQPVMMAGASAPAGHLETGLMPTGQLYLGAGGFVMVNTLSDGMGVFMLHDERQMWESMAGFPPSDRVAISPNFDEDGIMLASYTLGGPFLQRSTDGGRTWNVPTQSVSAPVIGVFISPTFASDQTAYAISYQGGPDIYWRSTDGGAHWHQVSAPLFESYPQEIVFSPYFDQDQTLFVRFGAGVLWRSTNGGNNWQPADDGLNSTVQDLSAIPLGNGEVLWLAATLYGLAFSLDSGQQWLLMDEQIFTKLTTGVNEAGVAAIFAKTADGRWLHTTNWGLSWTERLAGAAIHTMEVAPDYHQNHHVYGYSTSALYRSSNGGYSWTVMTSRPPISTYWYDSIDLALSPNFASDGLAFASPGTADNVNFILRSDDHGRSWQMITLPESGYQYKVAVAPDGQTVFAALGYLLYRSTDGGLHWTLVNGSLPNDVDDLKLSPQYHSDGTIFMTGNSSGMVYRSTNGGQQWTAISDSFVPYLTRLEISPGYPTDPTLFVYVENNFDFYRSDNGGDSWQSINTGVGIGKLSLSPNFAEDSLLFASEMLFGDEVFYSDNRGDDWMTLFTIHEPVDVVPSPNFAVDETLLVAQNDGTIYLSEDAGDSWSPIDFVPRVGAYGRRAGVELGYEDGLIVPLVVTADGVYRWQWPTLAQQPIAFLFEPGATEVMTLSLPLVTENLVAAPWQASETAGWLSVSPVGGTLPATIELTADPTLLPTTSDTVLSVTVDWSAKQQQVISFPVRALFVERQLYLPVVGNNFR